jgi:hypothetical protein
MGASVDKPRDNLLIGEPRDCTGVNEPFEPPAQPQLYDRASSIRLS